jgi:hypothetical protein
MASIDPGAQCVRFTVPFAFTHLEDAMNPEELNRTIQFIIESQARLAAAQERDREDRIELQEWSKSLLSQISRTNERLGHNAERFAQYAETQSELTEHQSRRMDRLDKFYEDWLVQNREFQRQALHLLNLILDRLTPLQP